MYTQTISVWLSVWASSLGNTQYIYRCNLSVEFLLHCRLNFAIRARIINLKTNYRHSSTQHYDKGKNYQTQVALLNDYEEREVHSSSSLGKSFSLCTHLPEWLRRLVSIVVCQCEEVIDIISSESGGQWLEHLLQIIQTDVLVSHHSIPTVHTHTHSWAMVDYVHILYCTHRRLYSISKHVINRR